MSENARLPTQYFTIFQEGMQEIEVKKSRFLCQLKRVNTEEEARRFVAEKKKEHWKARHHCSAFVVGFNAEIERSSDDGEPSGTAGVPMLEVLKYHQLVNVCAVVTRYFGGVKLGAGGLIRAYAQSVMQAVARLGIAKGVLQQEVQFSLEYSLHGKIQHFFEANSAYSLKETVFTDKVEIRAFVSEEAVESFQEEITNLLNGNVVFQLRDVAYHEVLVE